MTSEQIAMDGAASAFAQIARRFCAWWEAPALVGADRQVAAWLCELYAAGLGLPDVGTDYACAFPEIPADRMESARKNLSLYSGWYYREYNDPNPILDDESGMGDVGDDLLDTYLEIARGLLHFDNGSVHEALWHWSRMHRDHWGKHAVGALVALHCMSVSRPAMTKESR
jgi:hypothetical protein